MYHSCFRCFSIIYRLDRETQKLYYEIMSAPMTKPPWNHYLKIIILSFIPWICLLDLALYFTSVHDSGLFNIMIWIVDYIVNKSPAIPWSVKILFITYSDTSRKGNIVRNVSLNPLSPGSLMSYGWGSIWARVETGYIILGSHFFFRLWWKNDWPNEIEGNAIFIYYIILLRVKVFGSQRTFNL